jgi:hypothetical protein
MDPSVIVYLEAGTRKKVHAAARVGSVLLTAEGDNLDVATAKRELDIEEAREIVLAHPERRCRRCLVL